MYSKAGKDRRHHFSCGLLTTGAVKPHLPPPPPRWRTTNDYSQQDSIIPEWYYKANAQLLCLINAWLLTVQRRTPNCSERIAWNVSTKGHWKLWDLPGDSLWKYIHHVAPSFLQTSVCPAPQLLLLKVLPCPSNCSLTCCGVLAAHYKRYTRHPAH